MFRHYFALAVTVGGMALSFPAAAGDGSIHFTGTIRNATCAISINGGGPTASITLPTVSASTLSTAGATAGRTPFNMVLSGCTGDSLGTASTHFAASTATDLESGRLIAGGVNNVHLQLLNSNYGVIEVGKPSQNDVPVDISSGGGTLRYYVEYYGTGAGPVSTGGMTSYVEYSIVYQ